MRSIIRGTRRRVGPKAVPLGLGGALDDVVGRRRELAEQLGLVPVERALEVRREEAVLDVHAGGEAEFRHAPEDQRLVGRLLCVLGEQDDPAHVERAVDVVVAAVDVEGVLRQGAGGTTSTTMVEALPGAW